jgi:hypothetical protein
MPDASTLVPTIFRRISSSAWITTSCKQIDFLIGMEDHPHKQHVLLVLCGFCDIIIIAVFSLIILKSHSVSTPRHVFHFYFVPSSNQNSHIIHSTEQF